MAQKKEGKILGMQRETFRSMMGKYGVSIVMVVMIILIGIMEPRFLSATNLINVATQITINGMLAFGMCMAITTGGIDLTVGAQVALGAVILGICTSQNGLPLGESGIDPLVLLYKIRPVLALLSATPVPEDRLALYKKILKNMYASRQSSPRYWVDMIRRRYSEGKDLNTKYAEKIDAVTAEEVMEIIAALDSGSKVEYVVR